MRFKDLEGTNSDLSTDHRNNFAFTTDITQEVLKNVINNKKVTLD